MKHLSIILLLLAASVCAKGSIDRPWSVDAGMGIKTDRSLFGFKLLRKMSDGIDFQASYGVDFVGSLYAAGARWNFYRSPGTCFFFLSCTDEGFLSGSAIIAMPGRITSKTDGVEAEYDTSGGNGAAAAIGFTDVYSPGLMLTFEVSYRTWFSRPTASFKSGTPGPKDAEDFDGFAADGVGLGVSAGWRW